MAGGRRRAVVAGAGASCLRWQGDKLHEHGEQIALADLCVAASDCFSTVQTVGTPLNATKGPTSPPHPTPPLGSRFASLPTVYQPAVSDDSGGLY